MGTRQVYRHRGRASRTEESLGKGGGGEMGVQRGPPRIQRARQHGVVAHILKQEQ